MRYTGKTARGSRGGFRYRARILALLASWCVVLCLMAPAIGTAATQAGGGPLDIRGAWNTNTCFAGGAAYPQRWHITSEDLSTGAFMGYAGTPAFQIIGTVTSHSMNDTVQSGSYISHESATLTVVGATIHLAGTFKDNNGTTGTCTGTLIHVRLSGTVRTLDCGASGSANADSACRRTPRPGVTISVSGVEANQTTTGADGSYALLLPHGSYHVTPQQGAQVFDPTALDVTLQADRAGVDFTTCGAAGASSSRASTGLRAATIDHGSSRAVAPRPLAGASAAASDHAARGAAGCGMGVTWTMPDRLPLTFDNAGTADGVLKAGTGINDATPARWRVNLNLTKGGVAMASCPAGTTYHWSLTSADVKTPVETDGPCKVGVDVPRLGVYQARVEEHLPNHKTGPPITGKIVVRDWVIVGLGDSYASGEGNAPYTSVQCHRSRASYQYQVAQYLEKQDPKTSVTFLFAACSGARISHLVHEGYDGYINEQRLAYAAAAVPAASTLPPQLSQIVARLKPDPNRKVAAVLLSVGVNDINFGPVLTYCAEVAYLTKNQDCGSTRVTTTQDARTHALTFKAAAAPAPTLAEHVSNWVTTLDGPRGLYETLASAMATQLSTHGGALQGDHVFVTNYPDFSTAAHGRICRSEEGPRPRFGDADWQFLHHAALELNASVNSMGGRWTPISAAADQFTGHGYCAVQSWFHSAYSSAGSQFDFYGGFHPNATGQMVTARAVERALCTALYTKGDCTGAPR